MGSRHYEDPLLEPLFKQIKDRYQLGPALHLTHVENLVGICETGGIKARNQLAVAAYQSLANEDVQTARATIKVPFTNRSLHDYVPLYFGFKTPMVAWNQTQNEQMIFLRFSLEILSQSGVVISDGNARSTATRFFSFTNVDDLAQLDASAINTVKYSRDPELKRRKQAEILVPNFLPISECPDIIVFSMTSAATTLAILGRFGIKKAVRVNPGLYFGSANPRSDF